MADPNTPDTGDAEPDPVVVGPTAAPTGVDASREQMVRLTLAKTVTNASMRWVPFFLVTLEAAFDTSTATLAAILGFGEMVGLTTLFVGKRLDQGHERTVMVAALIAVAISGVVALQGSIVFFAISFVLLMLGAAHMTVSGHAWISARAPFERRARFLGIFETSWAMGLLIGAPIMALLISWFGWRGPFVAVAVAASVGAVMISRMVDTPASAPVAEHGLTKARLNTNAWVVIAASAAVAMTGLTTIVIVGTWMNEELGVSTGGIGLVAMAFGGAELTASSTSAAFADRLGKRKTTQVALGLVLVGLAVMSAAGSSLLIGALGLLVFFLGFEYAIVTTFSLVSEAMPRARGRALATNNAVGTVARGTGVILAGLLYERFGIEGPATLSAVTAAIAVTLLTVAALNE